jgi:hypothetical protein
MGAIPCATIFAKGPFVDLTSGLGEKDGDLSTFSVAGPFHM